MSACHREKRERGDSEAVDSSSEVSKRRRTNREHYDGDQKHDRIRLTITDYTVGWVCALPIEMAAGKAMLDNVHESLHNIPNDSNTYTFGNIGTHNIALACLPSGQYGTNNAATVAGNMRRSFPSIRIGLMVGIGGGVPGKMDVRLGDVVVSKNVVQYDLGKTVREGHFQRTGTPVRPPQALMTAVAKLKADHESESSKIPTILSAMLARNPHMVRYTHPGVRHDTLFDATYDHLRSTDSCEYCDESKLLTRPVRVNTHPVIHYGNVASGNQVMKHGVTRDKVAQEFDVLCFEMEAAGLMDGFPCLVIRGICDYSDSHKHKQWQEYAAATAAAYAKELLSVIPAVQPGHELPLRSHHTEDKSPEDRRQVLLDSLRFDQIDSRHSNIKTAHSKTCKWLLRHPDYLDWLDPTEYAQHQGFLWINGKPGAGKSTLMKFAFANAKKKTAGNAATVSFFFNARGADLEKSTVGMHRSLLLQVLEKLPDLQAVLNDPDLVPHGQEDSVILDIQLLRGLFSAAVTKLGQRRLTCFIDALDECDEDQVRDMVAYFEELGQLALSMGSKLYICFSSRHYPYIDIQNGRQLTLENQTGHGQDLEDYVRSNLSARNDSLFEEVRTEILRKAAGVFMWVVLVVDILNREFRSGRIFAVKKRLQEIPNKLSELFRDILRRDNENMEDLLLCVLWILYAKRPLKREEFYYAVVSGLDPDPVTLAEWDPENTTTDDMDRFVLSSSKGLAEVIKSENTTVQFIHESVRDFLLKDNGLQDIWPDLGRNFEGLGHERLKQCCNTYYVSLDLSRSVPDTSESLLQASERVQPTASALTAKYPFLEYATNFVLYHADAASTASPQDEFLSQFALPAWIRSKNLIQRFKIRRYTPTASMLYILAENNLAGLIKVVLSHDSKINIRGERYHYPILAALANGHRDAVAALLAQKIHVKHNDTILDQLEYGHGCELRKHQTPLQWAVEGGYVGIARLLLEIEDCDANSLDRHSRPLLFLAALKGHEAIVRLLLNTKGVDVNAKDTLGRTSLFVAANFGHEDVVSLLLRVKDIDINAKDTYDRTPLFVASASGYKAVVKLLLESERIDVNVRDHTGVTPLFTAIEGGHKIIAKLLLQAKHIDINAGDYAGWTPLLLAAMKNQKTIVTLLLSSLQEIRDTRTDARHSADGALLLDTMESGGCQELLKLLLSTGDFDINARGRHNQSLLLMAVRSCYEGTVKVLLETKGVDPNGRDVYSRTPLAEAASKGYTDIVKLLLEAEGVEIDSRDYRGRTPLAGAVSNGRKDCVELLLRTEGVDPNGRDENGRTPLAEAVSNGYTDIVKLLLKTDGVDIDSKSALHQTALSVAASNGHGDIVKLLLATGDVDINSRDIIGCTPVMRAASMGRKNIVQQLLEAPNIDVNSECTDGNTALSEAAKYGYTDIVEMLLGTKGVDASSTDN